MSVAGSVTLQRIHYGFFFLALFSAIIKVVFHLGVVVLPLVMLLLGLVTYLIHRRRALLLFFALLPLVNALPDLYAIGYPFNYLAPLLFYLSGLVSAAWIRRDRLVIPQGFVKPYLLFLLVVTVSVVCVFLRWSNITLAGHAFLRDTLVEPFGNRVSFATIFPVVSLFLYAVPPFACHFIRALKLDLNKVFMAMGTGFCGAILVAVAQRALDPDFLAQAWWLQKMSQGNGTFSDFNGFGLFAGVLLVYFVSRLVRDFHWHAVVFVGAAVIGILLSGSRTAFGFVLVAFGVFIFSRHVRKRVKIGVAALLIVVLGLAGGILSQRLQRTVNQISQVFQSEKKWRALDAASNWRITMVRNSAMMVSGFPVSGVGTGNFIFALKNLTENQARVVDLPLNHYLLILTENGVPGLLFFLVFLGGIVPLARGAPDRVFPVLFFSLLAFLLVNTYLWLPEVAVLFWVVIAMSAPAGGNKSALPAKTWKKGLSVVVTLILLGMFVAANGLRFTDLHPLTWVDNHGGRYDYGFWYAEHNPRGEAFKWTRARAGVFLQLNEQGKSQYFKVVCGAPLTRLPGKRQMVKIYWRGKLQQRFEFKRNGERHFQVEDPDHNSGFLEIRVEPVFNLKRMGLSPETRTLGVKFFELPAEQSMPLSEVAVLNPR